jgi:hypothetical protein
VNVGKRVIIADTLSFIEAPGLGEHLAGRGSEVEIVTPLANVGMEMNLLNHWEHLLPRVFGAGVKLTPFTWVKRIEGNRVTLYNFYRHEQERTEEVDNLVLITGRIQEDSLYQSFVGKVKELYLIGDAKIGGARIGNAMYDAAKLGREI